jgi:hypothetical protein
MDQKIIRTPYPKEEIWKKAKVEYKKRLIRFEDYEISNLGRIKRISNDRNWSNQTFVGKILNGGTHILGYRRVTLHTSDLKQYIVFIHRILAYSFLEVPNKSCEINHKDGRKWYNILSNIEFCSRSYNMRHSFQYGLSIPKIGSKNGNSILSEKIVTEIKLFRKKGISGNKLSKKFNINLSTIKNIISGRQWRHINV